MVVLNDVLGSSTAAEPPMRNVEGYVVQVHTRRTTSLHQLTSAAANDGDAERLPPPELPLITRLDEPQLAELIERHIDYFDEDTHRSVHLAAPFVMHFQVRKDDPALPVAAAVATLPPILPNGEVLYQPA